MLASVNFRAASSSQTSLSEPALWLSHCKNEECHLGRKQGEESSGEERLIKINVKMSGKKRWFVRASTMPTDYFKELLSW